MNRNVLQWSLKSSLLAVAVLLLSGIVSAQVLSGNGTATFSGSQSESFSITVPPTGTLTFSGGTATSSQITVSANWSALSTRHGVGVFSMVTSQTGGLSLAATETVNGSTQNTCNLNAAGLNGVLPGGVGALIGGVTPWVDGTSNGCSFTVFSTSPAGANQTASATYSYSTTGASGVQAYSLSVEYVGLLY